MKSKFKKLIIILMVFIICFNISFPLLSYSANIDIEKDFKDADSTWSDVGGAVLDGIVGIITWIPRAILAVLGLVGQTILTQLCGFDEAGFTLTAEDILFTGSSRDDQVNLLNINFFDFNGNGANESVVKTFRQGVATWYFALRNLSIIISLAILIYIGIRMAISTIASEKAVYKKMIVDWTVGFTILFFLHYIILLIITINNQLVDLIYSVSSSGNNILSDYTQELFNNIFSVSFVQGWGSLIVYTMLFGTTLALFVMYMKRLFTTGFLIVISPLITITYSIDKIGDGKSQALSTWLKEFSYNVLIQPFHCIIFMVFVSGAIKALDSSPSIANMIFAILAILFIFKAEGIVRKIFGFENASSMGDMVAGGAIIGSAVGKINSMRSRDNKTSNQTNGANKTTIRRKEIPGSNNNNNSNNSNNNSLPNQTANNNRAASSNTNNNVNNYNTNNTSANIEEGSNNKSALSRAMSDYIKDKKSDLREFKADPKGTLANKAKQIPLKQLVAMSKLAPKLMVGSMVAGATGNGMTGIITGYATPTGKFTRKLSGYINEDINNLKLEGDRKKLASAYQNYKMANKNLSDDQLYNKCADLLEVTDVDKIADKNERELAKNLQSLEGKMENNGVNNANVKVMDTVEDIQLGNIKNSVTVSLDSVNNAAKKMRDSDPPIGKDKIMDMSKEFIQDIDNSKDRGEKYIDTDKYKSLGKSEKELAKEIYKTKEVLSAIGDHSSETINKEIENSIEKEINE